MLRRTFLTRLHWHSLQTDIVAYIIQVYIIVNTSSHGIMNITWLWIRLYSQNFYQKKRVLHRSAYIEPVLTSCEECNAFADPFFRIYLCLFERFLSTSMFFCSSIYIETALNSRICGPFVLQRLWLCLSRDFVLWNLLIRSLYFIQVYNFLYLWYIPPHSCPFHTFCFTSTFSYVYYHEKYFSYPWWCCWSAKARNLIFILNFSIQRSQLNYA